MWGIPIKVFEDAEGTDVAEGPEEMAKIAAGPLRTEFRDKLFVLGIVVSIRTIFCLINSIVRTFN